jgi:pyruvate/2-oxoacid:ferredoxin oxidoreductase alpha subunit/pyruvate/2-oxoacid:ferredoxin oxidoreductase beta subunit
MAKKVMTGNEAVALGVLLSRAQVLPEYLITPATAITEQLSEFCAKGMLDAVFIPVESEHSAMAAAIGASYVGARVFTNSASHGTLLMHEMLHTASGMRRPIVFVNTNRAVGLPWCIGTDQIDSLSQRDTGWLQLYTENSQETLDTIIMAFKIAEHPEVQLPVMVVTEGFILSHTGEPVEIPEQDSVDSFLPPLKPLYELKPEDPHSFGSQAYSREYFRMKIAAQNAMERSKGVVKEVDREFGEIFGRSYGTIERFHWQKPTVALVTSGTITSTARQILMEDERFKNVGLLKIKMFRPFPGEEIAEALKDVEKVAVIDRNISLGHKGIFSEEIQSALVSLEKKTTVFGFITGLGGLDITGEIIKEAINYALEHEENKKNIIWLPEGIEEMEGKEAEPSDILLTGKYDEEELFYSGHAACQGCGLALGLRHVVRTLGKNTLGVIPAGCSSIITGAFPQSALRIPFCHVNFATGGSSAAGIAAAVKVLKKSEVESVLVWAGDGATYDIGMGSLSGAAERGDDIIYVCANNEAYMNTGIQRSSATPACAWSTTTPLPQPKQQSKKPMVEVMAAHRIPYAATASIAFPEDLEMKLKKAKSIKGGVKYIDLLCPCPTGWRFPPHLTVKLARLAVLTGIFPLFEIINGEKYIINKPDVGKTLLPIREYMQWQGRFTHLNEDDMDAIQKNVNREWRRLLQKSKRGEVCRT